MFKKVLHNATKILVILAQIFGTSTLLYVTFSGWTLVVNNEFNPDQYGLLAIFTLASIGLLLGTLKITHHIICDWLRKRAFKKALKETEDFEAWCVNSNLKGA